MLFFIYIDVFEKWDRSIELVKIAMCAGERDQIYHF